MGPINFDGLLWAGVVIGAVGALIGGGAIALVVWLLKTFGPSVSVVW